jgi:H+/Cl- antiporter ClcA
MPDTTVFCGSAKVCGGEASTAVCDGTLTLSARMKRHRRSGVTMADILHINDRAMTLPPFRDRVQFLRRWTTRAAFWLGAMAVGASAVGFARLCDWALHLHHRISDQSMPLVLLLPPVGLATVAWLTRYTAPGSQGSGIPQVIAALQLPAGPERLSLLSLRIAVSKILLTVAGLMSGASIGREGPTVHIGASIMDAIGRYAHFPYEYVRRSLVLAGGAAGLAAAFNTPIAGLVFAIEELARSFEERTTGTLLMAVVLAGIVSIGVMGNYTYFGVYNAHLPDWPSWWAVPICGLAGGLAGGLSARLLIEGQKRFAPYVRQKPVRTAALLGILIALIGIASHGTTLGTGYQEARSLLDGQGDTPGVMFPLLKVTATLLSYFSGIPGGIFSPTLATGAGLGADLAPLVPHAPFETMVLLGMAAYFVGMIQSPLTGAVIVMEMVNDHELIVPMLACAFLALGVSRMVCRQPIYRALAAGFAPKAT